LEEYWVGSPAANLIKSPQ